MSTTGQNVQQLRQEIQHELATANQLLGLICRELQVIKNFTNPGGEFESTIIHNASLITRLANLRRIDLTEIPPMVRKHIAMTTDGNQNGSNEEDTTITNESEIDDSSLRNMQI